MKEVLLLSQGADKNQVKNEISIDMAQRPRAIQCHPGSSQGRWKLCRCDLQWNILSQLASREESKAKEERNTEIETGEYTCSLAEY